jgi:Domain of unknown function (DUF4760)
LAATKEDAHLVVQLARLGADMGLGDASGFLWSDEFVEDYDGFKQRFPFGSEGARHVGSIAGFYETVATLVKNGLIDRDLIHDWLGSNLVWRRLEKILLGQREDSGEPRLWENFEALAAERAARPA